MNDKHALIKITKIWIIDQLIKTRTWNSGIYSIVPSVVAKHYIYISPTDAFGAIPSSFIQNDKFNRFEYSDKAQLGFKQRPRY